MSNRIIVPVDGDAMVDITREIDLIAVTALEPMVIGTKRCWEKGASMEYTVEDWNRIIAGINEVQS